MPKKNWRPPFTIFLCEPVTEQPQEPKRVLAEFPAVTAGHLDLVQG